MRWISAATRADRLFVGDRAKPSGARRVAAVGREQAIGVRALQVALDALGTEHAVIERELLPRLEADDLVVLDLELDAALLAAEAAMRLDEPIGLGGRVQPSPDRVGAVRAELGQSRVATGCVAMIGRLQVDIRTVGELDRPIGAP